MFNNIKNDHVKYLLKKYALLYVVNGISALRDLSKEDQRVFIIAYGKYVK